MSKFKRKSQTAGYIDAVKNQQPFGPEQKPPLTMSLDEPPPIRRHANILAIDAGFSEFGWAIFNNHAPIDCGVIINKDTKKKDAYVSDKRVTMSSYLARSLREIYTGFDCRAMIGELPTGGAKSSSAAIPMNMATAIIGAVAGLVDIPCEFCLPTDVKIATCGIPTATKDQMMDRIILTFGGHCDEKIVNVKRTERNPKGFRRDRVYHFCSHTFGANYFEHIADACGAYLALADGNLIKMLG